ncbi:copper resistance protein CopC [Streptomyces sp. DH41]|uniref:copper resistance protein CopC n=1 Tax=Streptomyces sp. DH41 TaxID=3040125 RepID=UPI00244217D3|nr:copper resistance protein CopC [Streptomyces sp. DH41]MDG9727416.1 copper resistance protein CopC [Streptomyces sp. DH41]
MLLGAVLVLFVLGGAGPASAHAALRSTDPEDGSVLQRAPRHVTLTFTESVGLRDDSFRVLDPGGHRVRTGDAGRADGRSDTARVALSGELGEGTYTVAWRVVSADSHPVSGAFTFSVGKASATTASVDTGPTENPLTATLHKIARYLSYLAAALLIGTAAFVALCRPPDPAPLRRPLVAGWWTLLGATVALLVLRAPYEAGTGPSTALDADVLGGTLTTRPGVLLVVRLALLVPFALFLLRTARGDRHRERTALAAAGAAPTIGLAAAGGAVSAVGLALTWAAAEHASAGIQVPVAMTSSVLHLLATAVWLGGLVALLLTLRGRPDAGTVARFSRIAFVSVTVLVVTGVYQSWRGLGSWPALTETTYGRLLLAKLAGVAVLLAAAAVSRRWTAAWVAAAGVAGAGAGTSAETSVETAVRERVPERVPEPMGGPPARAMPEPPEPGASEPGAPEPGLSQPGESEPGLSRPEPPVDGDAHRRGLRRSVLVEAVVAAVVLVVTTVLTGTLPGRAADEAAARAVPAGGVLPASVTTIPFDVGSSGRGTVQITLDPGRTGDNAVQAVVFGPDGSLAAVPELRLSFTLPDREVGPIDAELVDRGGYWSANSLTLPLPGTWTMKTTVRVSEIDQVSETRRIRIER